jgi:hypothetical protein
MWSRDGKHLLSCAAIALAGLLKIFPLMLLPWFAWRAGNRRGRLRCAAFAVVLVATGIGLTGVERWLQFLETGVPTFGRYAAMYFDCFSLPGLVARLGAGPLGQNLMAVAVVVVVYGLCWGATNREAEFCLLVTGMIGANLVGWAHYFVWLIFPVIVLAARPAPDWSVTRGAALALLLLLLNDLETKSTPWLDRHYHLKVLANSLPVIGVIAVGVFFARAVHREQS